MISLPLSCHFLTKGIIRRRKANIPQIPSPWLNHRLRAELESRVDVCSGVRLASADATGENRPDPPVTPSPQGHLPPDDRHTLLSSAVRVAL